MFEQHSCGGCYPIGDGANGNRREKAEVDNFSLAFNLQRWVQPSNGASL
jgi:hypothetical protein